MQLKILQWNVWFKEDIVRVVDVLKAHGADVICLQELTKGYVGQSHENTWEYIAHQLGYSFHFQEIPIITEDAQWLQANAIFSRYPLEHQMTAWLHKLSNVEDANDQYRGYLESSVHVGNTSVTIGTTHLSFNAVAGKDHELNRLLTIVEDRPKRYILTGDLNATPDSRRIAELVKRLQHAGPPYSENTWTTKPFRTHDFYAATLDWRYDYVFTSSDIEVVDARIVSTDVSDHLPVLVTVKVPL